MADGRGGYRPGSGRKKKADENRVRDLATQAIVAVYGSEENGFRALLRTGDPVLVKWVFEHSNGKPTDKLDITTRTEETRIIDVDENGNEDIDGDQVDDGEAEDSGMFEDTEDDMDENDDE